MQINNKFYEGKNEAILEFIAKDALNNKNFAMAQAFLRLKIVVEPGGAVALAAALFKKENIDSDVVVAVVTGGNVDSDLFQKALDFENV